MRLLDTNVCIGWLNGDPSIRTRWLDYAPDELVSCSVVRAELLFGARKSARIDANLRRLDALFVALRSLPFDAAAAERYGILRAQLEREGRPIGANDMMIAATALVADATVVTRNTNEFRRVGGLRIEEW